MTSTASSFQETKERNSAPKKERRRSFISRLLPDCNKNKTKRHENDHRGKLVKDGQFLIQNKYVADLPKQTATQAQVSESRPQATKEEVDAAIKLGRFVTVRRRLKAIAARRRKVQRYIKSIVVFLVFIVVFVLRNSSSDEDLFYSADKISEIFVEPKDYGDIHTVSGMWEWLSGTLCDNYYGQATFDGVENPSRDRWLFGTYRKVGGLRIGTLRVKKKSCGISSKMFNATDNQKLICYGYGEKNLWDTLAEDTESYGKDNSTLFTWSGWNNTDADARRSEGWFLTQSTYPNAHSYSSPAFAFVLPQTDKEKALSLINFAKNNGYVDFQTRMVMLDMTLLNGQTNSIMTLRFMFAMSKSGGVLATYEFMQVETEAIDFASTNFADMDQKAVWMLLELAFYIYFIIEIFVNMWLDHCKPADPDVDGDNIPCWKSNLIYRPKNYYLHLVDDLPDTFQLFNVVFYLIHWMLRIHAASSSPRDITFDTDFYIPIRGYSEALAYKRYAMVMVIFCVFFRFIFYLAIVPEFGVITSALTKSIRAIAGFIGVFFFFTVMFLMAGIQLFGTKLSGFRNLSAAFWSIFQMAMLGENFIEDMLNADRNLITGLYIVMFYVINTTMLLNMAIAIISDAYAESRQEIDDGKDADVKIGREIYRFLMLKIWKIPFIGSYLKTRYINYGELQHVRLRRSASGKLTLHQQIRLQQQQIEADRKRRIGDLPTNKNAERHEARITKTAAQQTLKELRLLSARFKELSSFVHGNVHSSGGLGGGRNESVEEFLFAHRKKNTGNFGSSQPSFVVDGVSARNHAIVNVVEIDNGKAGKRRETQSGEYGVL
jgi:hypothetical protein